MAGPQVAVVVGAGIVGLHVAAQLNTKGYEVYVLERDGMLGEQSSGRNSGVIHAGIFYQEGSLKEQACIEGNRLTYEWAHRLQVPHQACGKWIVPASGQDECLKPFFQKLLDLPIPAPQLLDVSAVQREEAVLRASAAIQVPSTGLIDAAGYVKAMARYIENEGAQLLLNCTVNEIHENVLQTSRGEIRCDVAFNCAGLFADVVAEQTGLQGYEIRPCRGDYYLVHDQGLKRPVYHLPYEGAPGLGVHLTPTLDQQLLIGPNAFFIADKQDYSHQSDPVAFEQALHYYLPNSVGVSLQKAYSGNRAKLFYQGKAVNDFVIVQDQMWVHVLGIESPGLTAAPFLARRAVELLRV